MSTKESPGKLKSYNFSKRIIRLYQHLYKEKKEFDLARQILRCGTSIGANLEEAQGGQSPKDFIAKISIAYKESRETLYWLNLLKDSEIIEENLAESLIGDCNELCKILAKTKITHEKNHPEIYK